MFPDTPRNLLKKIAELAQGDDCAEWEAFVEIYTQPLMRFIHLQSPALSEADVEDVVQDVFVRLVTVLREGKIDRTKAKFRAYLAAMTRRILIDRYRAAQVRPELISQDDELLREVDGGMVITPRSHMDADRVEHEPYFANAVLSADTIDPGTAVDILWRMAARDAAKSHIFMKTAISDKSKRIYELLEQGLSLHEVAAREGVSYDVVKQVKSRIDRAIAAIEQKMLP